MVPSVELEDEEVRPKAFFMRALKGIFRGLLESDAVVIDRIVW